MEAVRTLQGHDARNTLGEDGGVSLIGHDRKRVGEARCYPRSYQFSPASLFRHERTVIGPSTNKGPHVSIQRLPGVESFWAHGHPSCRRVIASRCVHGRGRLALVLMLTISALHGSGTVDSGTNVAIFGAIATAIGALMVGLLNYRGQNRIVVTTRFGQATAQLGEQNPDVRVGAIYALEQIMKTSRPERRAIIELLASYVLAHAPYPTDKPIRDGQPPPGVPDGERPLRGWARDVQAAMSVLGRRPRTTIREFLRGAGSGGLRGAYAAAAVNVSGADLRGGDLTRADLARTQMYQCKLQRAVLFEANLSKANLANSVLDKADLKQAYLHSTNLVGASLREADLRRADLHGADLRNARLEGALLSDARNLAKADLSGATGDPKTRWPVGFDPQGHGVKPSAPRQASSESQATGDGSPSTPSYRA